jgi:hypothetical protein
MLDGAAGGGGPGSARDGDRAYREGLQVPLGRGLAVPAVGGDRTGRAAGTPRDPADRWCKLGSVRRVTGPDAVIQDDAVVIVDDLGLLCRAPCNAALGCWKSGTT